MTVELSNQKVPFHDGQLVTTNFYPKEASQIRTVIRCYKSLASESGWLVNTVNESGKELLALDSHWYKPEGTINETDKPEEE